MPAVIADAVSDIAIVKPSGIHGMGLFAARAIQEDELIGAYEGPIVDQDGDHVLWVEDESGAVYGVDGQNEMRFVNHSPQANAAFYERELYATRDIGPGEEITHHYGDDWLT